MKKKIVFACAAIIALVLLFIFNPTEYALMPKCPFKLLTGLSCPGCGFQRAVHAMLHGRFIEAINYNFYFVYSGPYALLVGVNEWCLPQKYKDKFTPYIEHRYVVWFYIITFFIWLVVRNIYNI